jgi:hypothetical protein
VGTFAGVVFSLMGAVYVSTAIEKTGRFVAAGSLRITRWSDYMLRESFNERLACRSRFDFSCGEGSRRPAPDD